MTRDEMQDEVYELMNDLDEVLFDSHAWKHGSVLAVRLAKLMDGLAALQDDDDNEELPT